MRRFLLVSVVLLISGCAAIPTMGPVMDAGPNTVGSQTDSEFLPTGPAEGATQREILDGFISAGSAPQNNFRIARSFLTDAAALSWNPAAETMVRGVYDSVTVVTATEMMYSTGIVSMVDSAGVLTSIAPAQTRQWSFGFSQVRGEWRLSAVPDLTVISESTFSSAYGEYTAFFVNHDRTALVPDVRVFPRQADPISSVVRAVITGPSSYLPNASTSFPRDSELVNVLVDPEKGSAVVDVSEIVRRSSIADQQLMLSQLTASLGEFTDGTAITMSVNQAILTIPPSPGFEPNLQVDNRPLILRDSSFGYARDSKIESPPSNAPSILKLKPTSVSVDASTGAAAISSPTGVYRVTDQIEQVSTEVSSVEPQIGGADSVWWVETHLPDLISVFAGEREFLVDGPWPGTAQIVGMEVSRDDSRVAIALNDRGRGYVLVGAITADDAGMPTAVSAYRQLSVSADSIVDLAWVDLTHVAVLGDRGGVIHAEVATVGGGSRLIGQPQNPSRISGGNNGVAGLVVISGTGQLWKPRGGSWESTGISADLLATQR